MKAVQDEIDRETATQTGGVLGAAGGALIGAATGAIPNKIGNAINSLKDAAARQRGLTPNRGFKQVFKPGFRMAGGLTGLILGGGLGAGAAAMMKQSSPAGELLGKIQAQGGQLDALDERRLANMLGDIYNTPSQIM